MKFPDEKGGEDVSRNPKAMQLGHMNVSLLRDIRYNTLDFFKHQMYVGG